MANSDPGSPHKNYQCRWLHIWGKWELIEETTAGLTYLGIVTTQRRKCDRCGYMQTKMDTVWA